MDQRKIGGFISARRKENGLTQSQLAEKLGGNRFPLWKNLKR